MKRIRLDETGCKPRYFRAWFHFVPHDPTPVFSQHEREALRMTLDEADAEISAIRAALSAIQAARPMAALVVEDAG